MDNNNNNNYYYYHEFEMFIRNWAKAESLLLTTVMVSYGDVCVSTSAFEIYRRCTSFVTIGKKTFQTMCIVMYSDVTVS